MEHGVLMKNSALTPESVLAIPANNLYAKEDSEAYLNSVCVRSRGINGAISAHCRSTTKCADRSPGTGLRTSAQSAYKPLI